VRDTRLVRQVCSGKSDMVMPPAHAPSNLNGRRVANLERIARHFLGDVSLDEDNLDTIADRFETISSSRNGYAQNLLRRNDMAAGVLNVDESFDVHFISQNIARMFCVPSVAIVLVQGG
jgi:hypothetical protein